MVRTISTRWVVMLCLTAGAFAACAAQRTYTPPPPPLTTLPPCPVPKDAKEAKKIAKRTDCDPTNRPVPAAIVPVASDPNSPAKKFPFPGDPAADAGGTTPSAAKAFPFPGEAPAAAPSPSAANKFPFPGEKASGVSGAPDPGTANDQAAAKSAAETPAAKRFPYPGDSAGSTAPAPSGGLPAPESSSSSSSNDATPASKDTATKPASSDDDDDGQPQLADKGSEGKRNKKTDKPQADSDRVDEDLSIAKFYGQSGNPMGAYLRAKDAVKTEPDLPEARFVMGEAAKRLNKKDEAKAEFGEYLKLAPDGEHAQAAEKALSELR